MSGFWKHTREFIVPLGMAVLFVALVYFGVVRILDGNREKMVAIQQAVVDRKMLEEQSSGVSGMRAQVDHIRAAGDKLAVFLPKEGIIPLVEALESVGKDLHVSVVSEASPVSLLAAPPVKKSPTVASSVTPDASDDNTDSTAGGGATGKKKQKETMVSLLPAERSVFITFKVTGAYADALAFLQRLDTMPTLLDVLSFDIELAPTEDVKLSPPLSASGVSASPFRSVDSSPSDTTPLATPPKKQQQVLASFNTVIYVDP